MAELLADTIPLSCCPEVDCNDTRQYPYVNSHLFDYMRKVSSENFKNVIVFPFLNETHEGVCFVDLYFWDCSLPGRYTHAETTIVFIRKKAKANCSFAVMEVECNKHISQIFCADNMLPEREVFEFIEEYSHCRGFDYNPMEIIMNLIENECEREISEDLYEYISRFQKDYERRQAQFIAQIDNIHVDDPGPHQFTLEECFPGVFE